jgi:hypothetical protein
VTGPLKGLIVNVGNPERSMEPVLNEEFVSMTAIRPPYHPTLHKVPVCRFIEEMEVLSFLWQGTSNKVVENMDVAFPRRGSCYTVLLKVIVKYFDASQLEFSVFSKPRSVRVEESACVANCLEHEFGDGNLGGEFGTFFLQVPCNIRNRDKKQIKVIYSLRLKGLGAGWAQE